MLTSQKNPAKGDADFEKLDFEKKACEYIDRAYKRNKEYWSEDHKRQHRLFNMILQAPVPEKPAVKNRSNIKTGVSWMIHQLVFSILKNSLLTLAKNIRLEPTKLIGVIFWLEEMQEFLDRLISDPEWPVHGNLRNGLFDMVSHGTGVVRPYYRDDLRSVWDGENDMEVLAYSGPDMPYIASWDTYPTAGATCLDECHEIIFYEYYYPHELRAMEAAGKLKNVEELLKNYKEPTWLSSGGQSEARDPRRQRSEDDIATDMSGRIGVLVYWGLYPYYENEEYIDDDGNDRSKREFECFMIKPVDKDILLYFDRNPYYHQKKEAVIGRYFEIPGLFWGESIFSILEKMLIHQEDWFNIIQDSANQEVHRDRAISDVVPANQLKQKGVGRDYVIDKDAFERNKGEVIKYLERGGAVLPDAYERSNYIDRVIQEVGGIMDFLAAASGKVPKTATEIEKLSASLNIRFEQTAMDIGGNYLIPAIAWAISLLSGEEANDDFISSEMGTPINPFKQFSPMMPNQGYRVKLEGSLRAVQNVAMQRDLSELINQARNIPPGPDENGDLVQINLMRMFLDELKLSKLKDTDDYKMPYTPPPVPPEAIAAGVEGGPGE